MTTKKPAALAEVARRSTAVRSQAHAAEPSIASAGAADDFGAANLAAVARANSALMEGMEAIGAAVYAYAQDAFSNATSTAKSLIAARNLADVVALNGEFAQTALAGLLANSIRVSEIGMRAASAALTPLGERVAHTISPVSRPSPRVKRSTDL